MKYLRFNFCHPVKVHARLTRLNDDDPETHALLLDSKDGTVIEIPVDNYNAGKWKVMLDWEYDGQLFSHQKVVDIKPANYNF